MGYLLRKMKQIKKEGNKIKSIDLVKEINIWREKENKPKIEHYIFRRKIEEYNKDLKNAGLDTDKIHGIFYNDNMNRKQKCYLLSESQAMVFMSKESSIVTAMLIRYMDNLKFESEVVSASIEHTKETHDKIKELIEQLNWSSKKYMMLNREINDLVAEWFEVDSLRKYEMNTYQLDFRAKVEDLYIKSIMETKKHSGTKAEVRSLIEM